MICYELIFRTRRNWCRYPLEWRLLCFDHTAVSSFPLSLMRRFFLCLDVHWIRSRTPLLLSHQRLEKRRSLGWRLLSIHRHVVRLIALRTQATILMLRTAALVAGCLRDGGDLQEVMHLVFVLIAHLFLWLLRLMETRSGHNFIFQLVKWPRNLDVGLTYCQVDFFCWAVFVPERLGIGNFGRLL